MLVNSGEFSRHAGARRRAAITARLAEHGKGEAAISYRLRDWLVSRQRGWGAPIPIVYCEADPSCGMVPVPEDQLPVLLPDDIENWPAQGNPLETYEPFLRTTCPQCGGPGRRETDTLDTFVDSSWYWWRYLSPEKQDGPIDEARVSVWCPVQQYTGGAEHAVLHLLYARFWAKALNDLGMVEEREPWLRLFNQGQILGADGERMSKSRGNVQDPDELVARYGADTVRLFLMFMGPWDQGGPWSPTGIEGVNRFLRRVWTVATDPQGIERGDSRPPTPAGETAEEAAEELRRQAHRTLTKVTEDHADYPLEHDDRGADGADQPHVRLRGTVVASDARVGRERPPAAADAGAHRATYQRGALGATAGGGWRGMAVDPRPGVAEPTRLSWSSRTEFELPIQVNGRLRDVVSVPAGPVGDRDRADRHGA